jgi:hypothetical protein
LLEWNHDVRKVKTKKNGKTLKIEKKNTKIICKNLKNREKRNHRKFRQNSYISCQINEEVERMYFK